MASSGGDWIVTLDEDGQHDPRFIGDLLDTAMAEQSSLVYAKPTNPAPHGVVRNASSKGAKWFLTRIFAGSNAPEYQSYRLILGSIGRWGGRLQRVGGLPRCRHGLGRRQNKHNTDCAPGRG